MKKIGFLLFIFLFVSFITFSEDDATRGLKRKIKELDENATVGKQYTVLIAIDKYQYWNPLKNPVKDAKEIREILKEKYYTDKFYELYDSKATKLGIIEMFEELQNTVKENDSVFIYYAGHGHLDEKITKQGAWIPVDGSENEKLKTN